MNRIKWKVEAQIRDAQIVKLNDDAARLRVELDRVVRVKREAYDSLRKLKNENERLKVELDNNKRAAFENYQRMKRQAVVSGVPNAGYHEAERHARWKAQAGTQP